MGLWQAQQTGSGFAKALEWRVWYLLMQLLPYAKQTAWRLR